MEKSLCEVTDPLLPYNYFYVQYLLAFLWKYHIRSNYTTLKPYKHQSNVIRTKSKPQDFRPPCRIKTAPSKNEPNLYKGQVCSYQQLRTPKLFQLRNYFKSNNYYILCNSAQFLILSKSRMPLTHPLQSVD